MLLDILKEFPEQPLTFDINTGTNEVKIISDRESFPCRERVPRITRCNPEWRV
ncbi:MAG: hypothetical protein ACLTZT_19520 [Butyricimonas faecalis]